MSPGYFDEAPEEGPCRKKLRCVELALDLSAQVGIPPSSDLQSRAFIALLTHALSKTSASSMPSRVAEARRKQGSLVSHFHDGMPCAIP